MSNIFQALEQAQRKRSRNEQESQGYSTEEAISKASNTALLASQKLRDAAMVRLSRAIDAQLADDEKVIQIISAQSGEGVSFVVENLGRISASFFGKRVLIINAVSDAQKAPYSARPATDLDEINDGSPSDLGLSSASHHNLSYLSLPVRLVLNSCIDRLKAGRSYLADLGANFDVVLVDTPPLEIEPYGVELTRFTDGVVMVLEAEQTKMFAVENLKEKLIQNDGKILGVVFNKRCYHVPSGFYNWLH